MIRLLFTALLSLWASVTLAQTFPALYDVSGVAEDDVLNVRANPSAQGDLIGVFTPDQTDIEVVALSEDGRWARVNVTEFSGWASLGFLTLSQDHPNLPMAHLRCYGTEPFWSLDKPQTGPLTLSWLGEGIERWSLMRSQASRNRTERFSVIATNEDDTMIVTLTRALCSDGMSDQMFGIQTDIIRPSAKDAAHLSGCCSLLAN